MLFRRDMRITKRIVLAFASLMILYAIHGIYTYLFLQRLSGLVRTIHDHPLVVSNAALQANTMILDIHCQMKDVVLFKNPDTVALTAARVEKSEQAVIAQLDIVKANILGDEGRQIVSQAIELFNAWKPIRARILYLCQNGQFAAAMDLTRLESDGLVSRLTSKMDALRQYARNKATGFLAQSEHLYAHLSTTNFFMLLGWFVLSGLIAFVTIGKARTIENGLAEEKEKLAVTLKSIGDGVIATDAAGKVVMLNRMAEQMTGWTEGDACGQPVDHVFSIINEHTRKPCDNPVNKVLASGGICGLANHTVLVSRNGSERMIADSGAPIKGKDETVIGVVLVFRDQTQEASFRRQIIDSEKMYRFLSDNTVDVIWTMDFELVFTYANPAVTQLTGYTVDEWIGSRLPDHCDEANFAMMAQIVADEVVKGPQSEGIDFEAEMLKKNGEPFPVEIRGRIIYDEDGQPLRLQGVTRDITKRKRDEQRQRYQNLLLRDMGRLAKIGAWEFDPLSGKGILTEEAARIYDIDPAACDTNLNHSLSFYLGASRDRMEKAFRIAIERGTPYDLEAEIVSSTGAHKWVRSIGQPLLEKGNVVHIRGALQDITERKRFAQRIEHLNRVLRAIRDLNQLIVKQLAPNQLIHEGCRLLVDHRGYTSAMIILTDVHEQPTAWAGAGGGAVFPAISAMLERGELPPCCLKARSRMQVLAVQQRKQTCDGCPAEADHGDMHSLTAPLAIDDVLYGYLVVALNQELNLDEEERRLLTEIAGDIAYALKVYQLDEDRKSSEQQRRTLEDQLLQSQRMESVGRLAGGVAHDYNNMLSVIIGYTELALDRVERQDPLYTDLNEILAAAKRSADITRQLLAFARRQTIAPRVLNLNNTVEKMLKMLRRLIGEDIELAWFPAADLWPIKLDPAQVDQILANLCVNARDAISGVGKVTIETQNRCFDADYCTGHADCKPGDFVMLAVSDNGSGIQPEILDKVFEPFFTTKGLGKGTGLGLATVYGIVKQNNGFVNVYTEPGKGTVIKINLPRHQGAPAAARDKPILEIPPGRGETILLVEDDAAILNLGRKMLETTGYHVLAAVTPKDALALADLHAGRIDLLMTDVIMPEMNGRELSEKVAARCPGIGIVYMSGYTANLIAHRGVLEDGVSFIQKPFSRKEIAVKVRSVLDGKAAVAR